MSGNTAFGGAAGCYYDNSGAYGGAASDGGMDVLTTADDGTPTVASVVSGSTISSNLAKGGFSFADNAFTAAGGNAYTGGVTVSRMIDSTVANNSAIGGEAVMVGTILTIEYPGAAFGGGFGPGAIGGYSAGGFFDALTSNYPSVNYEIFNSTIAFNNASSGGVAYYFGSPLGVYPAGGGGVSDGTDFMLNTNIGLYSTIVAQNTVNSTDPSNPIGSNGFGPDVAGCFSDGHNLIGDTDGSFWEANFVPAYDMGFDVEKNTSNDLVGPNYDTTPYDPKFYSLANNGGLTKTLAAPFRQPGNRQRRKQLIHQRRIDLRPARRPVRPHLRAAGRKPDQLLRRHRRRRLRAAAGTDRRLRRYGLDRRCEWDRHHRRGPGHGGQPSGRLRLRRLLVGQRRHRGC